MQKRTKDRLRIVTFLMMVISLGVYLILYNLENNIVFFYPPSKLYEIKTDKEVRVGGLVKTASVIKVNGHKIQFTITDNEHDLSIIYQGGLPALFREGQGVVAKGKLSYAKGKYLFIATELLTKHDENYRPPEVEKSLK